MANENKTYFAKAASDTSSFSYKDIFSGVLTKHSRNDTDRAFSSGLHGSIPEGNRLLDGWQKPWLFSRFLAYGLIAWIVIAIMVKAGLGDIGSLLMIPSAVVPIALTIFFWEMNIPRNIPIYVILKMFVFSVVGTGIVWNVVNVLFDKSEISQEDFSYWLIVGIVEELTKLILIALVLRKSEYCWGLNGLAIGAAVGCGFAVTETISYGIANILEEGFEVGLQVFSIRGITCINGHVAWAAMYGAALALAKGKQKLDAKHFTNSTFLITFIASILLHAAFDYYPNILFTLFEKNEGLLEILFNDELFPFIHAIIFAIPTYALILWVMRLSVRQVVDAATVSAPHQAQVMAPAHAAAYAAGGAASAASVLQLECVSGELAGQTYTLKPGRTITIGRGAQNVVQFSDDAKGISRSHCSVAFDGNQAIVIDLGSTHGTFFSDGRKFQPNLKITFRSGETFYLASSKNTFRVNIH